MKTVLEEFKEQINDDKELLSVLPKKEIRKIREFKNKIEKMIEDYNEDYQMVLKEIKSRYKTITDVQRNPRIDQLKAEIKKIDNVAIANEEKTAFEKMELDRLVYDINGYYKKNLETTNQDIYECIQKFRQCGINISSEDFNISEYAKEYLSVLIYEADNGNINSERVKNQFEETYWKCNELISHVLVNIRYLYDKNEKEIKKYYSQQMEEMNVLKSSELENKKFQLIKEYEDILNLDKKHILEQFLNGELNLIDYRESNYNSIYEELVSKSMNELSDNEKEEIEENIRNLNDNLQEYFNYLKFKFINDEVIALKEKGKQKKNEESKKNKEKKKSEQIKAEIVSLFNQIFDINAKSTKPYKLSLFLKKDNEKDKKLKIIERNNNIIKIKELYAKFDDVRFRESIEENINEASEILDVLKFASYNYGFLAKTIIKQDSEIQDNEIAEMINEIRNFVTTHSFSVINNINIYQAKDISIIIKDKYKMTGFNVSKENFQESDLEDLINKTNILKNFNNIKKTGLSLEDIQFAGQVKDIVKQ